MTCHEFIDFLDDYLDGSLSLDQRTRFDEHLAECPDCQSYLESYQRTIRLGKAALADGDEPVAPDVPEDLVRAILAARPPGAVPPNPPARRGAQELEDVPD